MPKMIVFTADQAGKVGHLAGIGLNNDQIAAYFEISASAFDQVLRRQPEVKKAISKGRASALADVAGSLYQGAMSGNVTEKIFYLKTRGRWREADKADAEPDENSTIAIGYNPRKKGTTDGRDDEPDREDRKDEDED